MSEGDNVKHRAIITAPPGDHHELTYRWVLPEFEAVDGHGALDALSVMDGLVLAIVSFEEGMTVIGSGVMVAPGLMLSATHVIDEVTKDDPTPFACSFLPGGELRIWGGHEHSSGAGRVEVVGLHTRRMVSDIAVASCELMSAPHAQYPVLMASIDLGLPLVGDRLWAVGYRQTAIDAESPTAAMLVSSGLVTACYPDTRNARSNPVPN